MTGRTCPHAPALVCSDTKACEEGETDCFMHPGEMVSLHANGLECRHRRPDEPEEALEK